MTKKQKKCPIHRWSHEWTDFPEAYWKCERCKLIVATEFMDLGPSNDHRDYQLFEFDRRELVGKVEHIWVAVFPDATCTESYGGWASK